MVASLRLPGEFLPEGEIDLVEAALGASGVATEEALWHYFNLYYRLWQDIHAAMPASDRLAQARYLFHYLGRGKPQRYRPGGPFRLTQVLEAQLDPRAEAVGNCLGLTVLYNALAQRFHLPVGAIYLESAFHGRPHVLTCFHSQEATLDIEHVFPTGFDYPGHRASPGRVEWGSRELVADLYLSRGNELFQQARWAEAAASYDEALEWCPGWEKAALNRAMALAQKGS